MVDVIAGPFTKSLGYYAIPDGSVEGIGNYCYLFRERVKRNDKLARTALHVLIVTSWTIIDTINLHALLLGCWGIILELESNIRCARPVSREKRNASSGNQTNIRARTSRFLL